MFIVNNYKIAFKRVWLERTVDINGAYVYGNGRYDTICEIYVCKDFAPRFTGIAKLHPNDQPDKIIGKKIALRNAIGVWDAENEKAKIDEVICTGCGACAKLCPQDAIIVEDMEGVK